MTHVFHRNMDKDYPVAVSAKGIRVTDAEGRTYIDGAGGAAVCSMGYGDPDILKAIHAQIDKLAYVHSSHLTTEVAETLAARLVELSDGAFSHVYFVSGGSEAIETALKMARQYAVAKGETSRTRFLSRRNSYHGNTLGALGVGGDHARRKSYLPLLAPPIHVSPCYPYREQGLNESDATYVARLLAEIKHAIETAGHETIVAFIAEPVVGASLGAVPALEGYFAGVRRLCDDYGILLILDEVMCGMGRTGTMFAYEQEEIRPDIAVIAKGLGGGYQPIGAALAAPHVYETLRQGGGFSHGHTYMDHASACAASLAVLDKMAREALVPAVAEKGRYLKSTLARHLGQLPWVGDIRGRGLFAAVELVEDQETKRPLPSDLGFNGKLRQSAMANGLMCYPVSGFLDGRSGDHILLAPAFIATEAELDEIAEKLARAIKGVLGE